MTSDKSKAFCYECLEDVSFITANEDRFCMVRGAEYPYKRMVARCAHCNEELNAFNDENLKLAYDAYRDANNIISLEKIREIPVMFGIGKRVLSTLLGWGALTFSRFYDGDLPTKQYSDVLQKLYDEPWRYMTVLEAGKDAISEVAYRKSRLAIQELLSADATPILKVAGYLRGKKKDLSSFRLQKLLYYIQGVSAAFMAEPMFLDPCDACANGPVYRVVLDKYGDDTINPNLGNFLTEDECKTVDSVLECFGCFDGDTLALFTHNEAPWIDTRGNLPSDAESDMVIPLDSIKRYFDKVKADYSMTSMSDMSSYVRDLLVRI